MQCYNLLDNFDWNIREPASQKHLVQSRTDRKTRKATERIQDQSQEGKSTSCESDKEYINCTPNQLRFLERMGRDKKIQNNRSDNSFNNLNKNKDDDKDSAADMKASRKIVVLRIWRQSKESVVLQMRRQVRKRHAT